MRGWWFEGLLLVEAGWGGGLGKKLGEGFGWFRGLGKRVLTAVRSMTLLPCHVEVAMLNVEVTRDGWF